MSRHQRTFNPNKKTSISVNKDIQLVRVNCCWVLISFIELHWEKINHDEIEREVPMQLEYHRGRYVKPDTGAPFQVRFAQRFPSLPYCRRASHPSTIGWVSPLCTHCCHSGSPLSITQELWPTSLRPSLSLEVYMVSSSALLLVITDRAESECKCLNEES
jgi:hypothetical protein